MRTAKKVTLILVLIGLSLFTSLTWYKFRYSMEYVPSYSVESINSKHSLLIATQGSDYKRAVVSGIIQALKERPIDIQIIDVTDLSEINVDDWNAMVVLHTWESWKPQQDAMIFIDANLGASNMVVLTTSGQGNLKMEGVYAITSASDISNVENDTAEIIRRIDAIIVSDSD